MATDFVLSTRDAPEPEERFFFVLCGGMLCSSVRYGTGSLGLER
jgi:hypothetical protein